MVATMKLAAEIMRPRAAVVFGVVDRARLLRGAGSSSRRSAVEPLPVGGQEEVVGCRSGPEPVASAGIAAQGVDCAGLERDLAVLTELVLCTTSAPLAQSMSARDSRMASPTRLVTANSPTKVS